MDSRTTRHFKGDAMKDTTEEINRVLRQLGFGCYPNSPNWSPIRPADLEEAEEKEEDDTNE